MKTSIYIIRHAEAAGNVARTFQGNTDAEVTPKGKQQLNCLAERFRAIPFEAIYTSPLQRTRETAQAANRYHSLPLQIEPRLIEINGGEWEGLGWDELPVKYPEQHVLWEQSPHLFEAPNGEAMREVAVRVVQAIGEIARNNEGKTVVVVSHGGAIRNYLCYAFGWPRERLRDVDWEENTAVSLVEYDDAFCPSVVFHGDASHLASEQCTLAHQTWWRETVEK